MGPPSSSQGGKSRSSTSRVPSEDHDDPWAKWARWDAPATPPPSKAPPKSRPDAPSSRAAPKTAPEPPPVVKEEEWYSSAPPEGIVPVEMLGKDYDGHNNIRYTLWAVLASRGLSRGCGYGRGS